jgi:hypothetical protein
MIPMRREMPLTRAGCPSEGVAPFYEPGLDEVLESGVSSVSCSQLS